MSKTRKERIYALQRELADLENEEKADRRTMLKARVDVLFQDLHLDDVTIVRELVNEHAQHLHALEGDDDE